MDLLTQIITCKDEELKEIIDNALANAIKESIPKEKLGFIDATTAVTIHKGFIHPETKIQYTKGSIYNYSMRTRDFYYEFAKYIKNNRTPNIGNLIKNIETFINYYFGVNKTEEDNRDNYLFSITLAVTETDEEAFKLIDELEIGSLKGKRVAMCTEKASLAQNLISLFGIETYWCMGNLNNNGKEEAHCFNIVKAKNNYMLLDYSVPSPVLVEGTLKDWAPFQGEVGLEELNDVLNGKTKEYRNYTYLIKNNKLSKIYDETIRTYKVEDYSLNKNKSR